MSESRHARYTELEAALAAAQSDLRDFLRDWAADCGVKPGDVVPVNSGYSYEGKQMIVGAVAITRGWTKDKVFAVCRGKVLKKDGTPGLNVGEHKREIQP